MSRWFSGLSLHTIYSPDKYYFISHEACEKGFVNINYAENVKVNENEICDFKRDVSLVVVPKWIIQGLIPAQDFTIKVSRSVTTVDPSCNDCTVKSTSENHFDRVSLGLVLNNNNLKSVEYLSHAILSTGNPCFDMGKEFLIISNGVTMPKFTDQKVLEKLNNALNWAVWGSCHSSEFNLVDEANPETRVTVSIGISDELKDGLTSTSVGRFMLPK
jgi:hypothetical protein